MESVNNSNITKSDNNDVDNYFKVRADIIKEIGGTDTNIDWYSLNYEWPTNNNPECVYKTQDNNKNKNKNNHHTTDVNIANIIIDDLVILLKKVYKERDTYKTRLQRVINAHDHRLENYMKYKSSVKIALENSIKMLESLNNSYTEPGCI